MMIGPGEAGGAEHAVHREDPARAPLRAPRARTGMYSGLQPAITALIAAFSTVQGGRLGGTLPITSSGLRRVPRSMRRMRASVGGTTGRPSVQPRSKQASIGSSHSPTRSAARGEAGLAEARRSSCSCTPGSRVFDPQPGRKAGRPSPEAARRRRPRAIRARSSRPRARFPCRRPMRIRVGTVSTSKRKECSSALSSMTRRAGRESRVVLGETVSAPARQGSAKPVEPSSQVGQSRLTKTTRPSLGSRARSGMAVRRTPRRRERDRYLPGARATPIARLSRLAGPLSPSSRA